MPNKAQAQGPVPGYVFDYDASGDRKTRTYSSVIYLKSADTSETRSLVGLYNVIIYPNPSKGLLTVSIPNLEKDAAAKLYITDFSGNKLFTSPINSADNVIDLSKHPNGTYFLTIVIGEHTETFKIMKVE
jgi:hypothetical protein